MTLSRPVSALIAVIAIYALAQISIGPMLARSVETVGEQIAATTPGLDGSRGPIMLRGSSICAYVVPQSVWRRWLGLVIYPQAARAGERIQQNWRIEYVRDQFGAENCQRSGRNAIRAWPQRR